MSLAGGPQKIKANLKSVVVFFVFIFSIFSLFPQPVPGEEDAARLSPPPSVNWYRTSPILKRVNLSAFGVSSGEKRSLAVGTVAGEIFLSVDQGQSWKKVKDISISPEIVKKIETEGSIFLRKLGDIKENDIEALFEEFKEEAETEIDIRDVSYDDLSFEDIDLNAVDIADIEFREDIDPETVDLDEIDEEDIESIEITDETYLKNPAEVFSRLAAEAEAKKTQDLNLNRKQLKRITARYASIFFKIKHIVPWTRQSGEFFVLSPVALFRSSEGGERWQNLLSADLVNGETFVWLETCRKDPSRMLLLTSSRIMFSFDDGLSWKSLPYSFGESKPVSIHFMGDDERQFGILTNNELSVGTFNISDIPSGSIFELPLQDKVTGDFFHVTGTEQRMIVGCEEGIYFSDKIGKTWQKMPATGLPRTPIETLLSDLHHPDWIFALVEGVIYFSTDKGNSFKPISFSEATRTVLKIHVESRKQTETTLWALTDQEVFFLEIPASGQISLSTRIISVVLKKEEPSLLFPDYLELSGRAKKACLWDLNSYNRWRRSVRLVNFIPRVVCSLTYSDRDQMTLKYNENISFQSEPERYLHGPLEMTSYNYLNEYYMVSFFLEWDLGKIVHSMEQLSIRDSQAKSYRRMRTLERKFRTLYFDLRKTEQQLQNPQKLDLNREMELLLKTKEIEALLNNRMGLNAPVIQNKSSTNATKEK
ncbi:hypothetical protein ACFL27_11260 [candidate division CSSED10-310 bacterium]|uniref:Photosynthesis system II assembly factor Ycf48/Hcf136-like domain-containing protein n=1 Tax=candidate division CSSED10-310 bacterium TaxID=2855610 RepID=A0ABV6YX29_UNCC1